VAKSVTALLDQFLVRLRKYLSAERYGALAKRLSIIGSDCLSTAWPTTIKVGVFRRALLVLSDLVGCVLLLGVRLRVSSALLLSRTLSNSLHVPSLLPSHAIIHQLYLSLLNSLSPTLQLSIQKTTLTVFLQVYVRHSTSPLKTIECYVTRILPESSLVRAKKEAGENEESSSVTSAEDDSPPADSPTLSLHTLPVFFTVLLCELNENLSQQRTILLDVENTPDHAEAAIRRVGQCVLLFHGLVELTRVVNRTQISGAALRHGRVFVDELVHLIPVLNQSVRVRKTILPILANIQRSTRVLQILCLHGKQNETKLAPLVPPVKRAMENLIYKVKAMMVDEELGDAFSIHYLRNRNLAGETISTPPDDQQLMDQGADHDQRDEDEDADDDEEGVVVVAHEDDDHEDDDHEEEEEEAEE
jgi:Fanconi anaemia protein FancD2 nuclease